MKTLIVAIVAFFGGYVLSVWSAVPSTQLETVKIAKADLKRMEEIISYCAHKP